MPMLTAAGCGRIRRWRDGWLSGADGMVPALSLPDGMLTGVPALTRLAELAGRAAADARLPLIGIDNLPGAVLLDGAPLPRRCVLLFGQEGPGLSGPARAACDRVLFIAQYGSTRSINAGVASGIAMHAWIRAHAGPPPE